MSSNLKVCRFNYGYKIYSYKDIWVAYYDPDVDTLFIDTSEIREAITNRILKNENTYNVRVIDSYHLDELITQRKY